MVQTASLLDSATWLCKRPGSRTVYGDMHYKDLL